MAVAAWSLAASGWRGPRGSTGSPWSAGPTQPRFGGCALHGFLHTQHHVPRQHCCGKLCCPAIGAHMALFFDHMHIPSVATQIKMNQIEYNGLPTTTTGWLTSATTLATLRCTTPCGRAAPPPSARWCRTTPASRRATWRAAPTGWCRASSARRCTWRRTRATRRSSSCCSAHT